MAKVVSVQWFKRGILVLLAGALALTGSLAFQAQDAKAQPIPGDFPIEVLFMSLQIDYVCSSNYTGIDRIGGSIPIMNLVGAVEAGTFDGPSFFNSPCRSYESTRISLSLNPQLFMRALAEYGPGGNDGVQGR